MCLKCFVLLCLVFPCFSAREIGEGCNVTRNDIIVPGVCTHISNCYFAMVILYNLERKPPTCWFEDDVRIVCCPLKSMWTELVNRYPGVEGLVSMICHYDPELLESDSDVSDRLPPDPTGCPRLDKPTPKADLNAAQLIAWNKCAENQRHVMPCTEDQRGRLVRIHSCKIPKDRFRISGGEPAMSQQFPHMVVLGVVENCNKSSIGDVQWVAGGALVSDRFVLTAAHVLSDPSGRHLRYALMGVVNKTDAANSVLHIIVDTIPHPLADYRKLHDIALLKLDRRVTLSAFVRPICLPVPGQDADPVVRDIAGWGKTAAYADVSQILYTASIDVQSNSSECKKKFDSDNFHYNSSTMICAKGKIKKLDSCEGDSGGPLMAQLRNIPCSYAVEGVVSFGPHCGQGSAGVYTRVSPYLEWIVQNVWPHDWNKATASSKKVF